jgi:hypothetical protein
MDILFHPKDFNAIIKESICVLYNTELRKKYRNAENNLPNNSYFWYMNDVWIKLINILLQCLIPGPRREVDENCALLWYYAAYSGNSLPTFRDNLWVPSSKVKKFKMNWTFKMGQMSCLEITLRNYHYKLRNIPEERRYHSYTSIFIGKFACVPKHHATKCYERWKNAPSACDLALWVPASHLDWSTPT